MSASIESNSYLAEQEYLLQQESVNSSNNTDDSTQTSKNHDQLIYLLCSGISQIYSAISQALPSSS